MNLEQLNQSSSELLQPELLRCCGSARWVEKLIESRPYVAEAELYSASDRIWQSLKTEDWLEAFSHHPKIGDLESLKTKFASTSDWASGEQGGVALASERVIEELAAGNTAYEEKFGYIFIVCATGKTAGEMLALLQERLHNAPDVEIQRAMAEQNKITRLRLEKLLGL
ncbi:MAG: 2-oxo-4-hydroxy-4-carboxy-5-ureidoimidazoline decarboxylase [Candidatus Obscuribacterales bacterium]